LRSASVVNLPWRKRITRFHTLLYGVTASIDKTGGAADADWMMETHGLNVAKDYFDKAKVAAWKEAAAAPAFIPALVTAGFFGAPGWQVIPQYRRRERLGIVGGRVATA